LNIQLYIPYSGGYYYYKGTVSLGIELILILLFFIEVGYNGFSRRGDPVVSIKLVSR
jgi:hypothetical protein